MNAPPAKLVHVIQGEFAISEREDEVLTTVLGSCVAVCLTDPIRRIGGMNHFLLASGGASDAITSRYGVHAMEMLINALLKEGAKRDRLRAKLFGGANMIGNLRDIGAENAGFARRFLADEGIPCLAESLGGRAARRIRFWTTTGRVRQMTVDAIDLVEAERTPPAPRQPPESGITLF